MRQHGEWSPRPPAARALRVEVLEDRWLLSGRGQLAAPQPPQTAAVTGADVTLAHGAPSPMPRDAVNAQAPGDTTVPPGQGAAPPVVAAPADATAPNGGGSVAPADPSGGGGTSIVVLSPSANASSPPFGGSSDQGGQSPPDGGSTAHGSVSSGPWSPEDTATIAEYEAAWLQASAIPLTAGGTVGVNAVGVNAPGNRFAIAPASTSHVTPAPVQNGRPAFVGGLVGPARTGLVRTISWSQPADDGPFDFVPPAEVSGTGARPESDRRFADTYMSAGRVAAPSSRTSDLLTDFIPFDRTSLDRAIDRFLDHFEDLDARSSHPRRAMEMLSEGMAVAVALTASKAVLKSLWRSSDDVAIRAIEDADGSAHFEGAPGLPDPWSLGET